MSAAVAEREAFLWCYLTLRMDLIEVVTGILPHLVTESNNNLCPGVVHLIMQCRKEFSETDWPSELRQEFRSNS